MQAEVFYRTLGVDRTTLEQLGFNPYYRPLSGLRGGRPASEGQTGFDLASNDYLGLASDVRIQEAMISAVREYGSSQCGTPVATGYARILAELERVLARFIGLEAVVVFPSCYQANLALFPAIAAPSDVILIDHYAHASLAQGVKAVGCKIKPFLHNDFRHLERQLAASAGFRQIFVVTESVFSAEGSIAPLRAIAELCRRYQAIPVVDDSHGLGVLGRAGHGILEEQGIRDYEGIYTASLGKALANVGGIVAGKHTLIEALRYSCAGLIYSTALPPVCVAGVLRAIAIIDEEFAALGRRMWSNHRQLTSKLAGLGFDLSAAAAPIAAIKCHSPEETILLAKTFWNRRILTTPFVPPSVPPGQGTLRLIIGAKLQESALCDVLAALDEMALDLAPSAVALR